MGITLAIDEGLAERAREVARDQGLSLNEMIRRFLQGVAGDQERPTLAERYRGFPRSAAEGPSARNWTSEDAYEERG